MSPSMRHRTARAHPPRRSGNLIRNKYESKQPGYQHIQTKASESPTIFATIDGENQTEDFIIKQSIQEEIQDQLEYESRILRPSSPITNNSASQDSHSQSQSLSHPRTFAEAAMATRSRRRKDSTKDEGLDMSLSGPMTLESLTGPFKYTFKKKKNLKLSTSTTRSTKYTPVGELGEGASDLDLDIDIGIEVDNDMDMGLNENTSENESGSGNGSASGRINPEMGGTSSTTPQQQENQPSHILRNSNSIPEFTFTNPPPKRITQILRNRDRPTSQLFDIQRLNDHKAEENKEKEKRKGKGKEISRNLEITIPSSIEPVKERFPPFDLNYPVDKSQSEHSKFSSVSNSSTGNTPNLVPIDSGIDLTTTGALSLAFLDYEESDTQSVRERSEAAMARLVGATVPTTSRLSISDMIINDGFDSVQWDPDLPARTADNSPEPLSAEPQPVTYTTVGSRVNPNAQPQIAAPNRIQREGSIRRPPLDPIHNRQSNYYSHNHPHQRGPPPPLSMANSMHYAQQLGQSSGSFNTPPSSSTRSLRASRSVQRLSQTDQEAQALLRLQGMVHARSSGGFPVSPNTPTTASHTFTNEDKDVGRTQDVQGPIQGLEKMQTLQRLARFENPMQASALRRLSEFATRNTIDANANLHARLEDLSLQAHLPEVRDLSALEDTHCAKNGELDRGYTFPPPGLANPTYNPLYSAYGGANGQAKDAAPTRAQAGYPRPLTAGPPGHRSYSANRQNTTYSDESWPIADQVNQGQTTHGNQKPTSPWQASKTFTEQYTAPAPVTVAVPAPVSTQPVSTHATNTKPVQEIAKYYPHGWPSDMTANYTPLSYDLQKEMGQIQDEETPDQVQAKRDKELDDWFYSGQRRWNMTTEEYENPATNPFGPIGPPSKKSSISDNRPLPGISIQEMNKKSIPEVVAPMLDATYGNLLALTREVKEPGAVQYFNRYVKSPDWHIDSSDRGNDSFFGEDWGVPVGTMRMRG